MKMKWSHIHSYIYMYQQCKISKKNIRFRILSGEKPYFFSNNIWNMYYMYDYLNNHCKQCKEMKPYNIAFWDEEISIPKYHNPS